MSGKERRRYPRILSRGNAEITSITGRLELPEGRSSLLNTSRSGALLRVPSPRRRLFQKLDPVLRLNDSVTCVMRVPPNYQEIEMFAEVMRVRRAKDDPDMLEVGLRFFYDPTRQSAFSKNTHTFNLLGPDAETSSDLVPALPAGPKPDSVKKQEKKKKSGRNGRSTSKRVKKSDSGRASKPSKPKPMIEQPKHLEQRLSRVSARLRAEASEPTKSKRSGRNKRVKDSGKQAKQKPKSRRVKIIDRRGESSGKRAKLVDTRTELTTVPKRTSGRRARLDEHRTKIPHDSGVVPPPRTKPRIKPDPRFGSGTLPALPSNSSAYHELTDSKPTPSTGPEFNLLGAPAVYSGLTGPELGLYVRGNARLDRGSARFRLPEHFAEAADPETLTVHLTPCGDCHGLYVAAKTPLLVVVRELGAGRSCASFDYLVIAQRKLR